MSAGTIVLYHGTSWETARQIEQDGFLRPRGERPGTYTVEEGGGAPSRPECVYLTKHIELAYDRGADAAGAGNAVALVSVSVPMAQLSLDEDEVVGLMGGSKASGGGQGYTPLGKSLKFLFEDLMGYELPWKNLGIVYHSPLDKPEYHELLSDIHQFTAHIDKNEPAFKLAIAEATDTFCVVGEVPVLKVEYDGEEEDEIQSWDAQPPTQQPELPEALQGKITQQEYLENKQYFDRLLSAEEAEWMMSQQAKQVQAQHDPFELGYQIAYLLQQHITEIGEDPTSYLTDAANPDRAVHSAFHQWYELLAPEQVKEDPNLLALALRQAEELLGWPAGTMEGIQEPLWSQPEIQSGEIRLPEPVERKRLESTSVADLGNDLIGYIGNGLETLQQQTGIETDPTDAQDIYQHWLKTRAPEQLTDEVITAIEEYVATHSGYGLAGGGWGTIEPAADAGPTAEQLQEMFETEPTGDDTGEAPSAEDLERWFGAMDRQTAEPINADNPQVTEPAKIPLPPDDTPEPYRPTEKADEKAKRPTVESARPKNI